MKINKVLIVSLFLLLFSWIFFGDLEPGNGSGQRPTGRGYFSMAYDSKMERVILYGGQSGDGLSYPEVFNNSDTWAFNPIGKAWEEKRPTPGPMRMSTHALIYNSKSGQIILYGGVNLVDKKKDLLLRETWAYDCKANTWKRMADGPTGRFGYRLTYDEESDKVILFAGAYMDQRVVKHYQDTWTYDFSSDTWREMKPSINPPPRHFYEMVYDRKSDRVILWGGWLGEKKEDSSVWAYDFNTNTWSETKTVNGPSPRGYHAMAYDQESERIILYGGGLEGSDETWSYDPSRNIWTRMKNGPGKLSRLALAYSPKIDRCILFGGQLDSRQFLYSDETWFYDFNNDCWENVTEGQYPTAERLPNPVNTGYEEGHPSLAVDESFLLFHSTRPNGFGKMDLWAIFRRTDLCSEAY